MIRKCIPARHGAFTLLELLVTITIIAILGLVSFSGLKAYRGMASRTVCSSNLRQLGAAVNLYSSENQGFFPPYVQTLPNGGRMWYFGSESTPPGTAEGNRDLDTSAGPLYPYIQTVGKLECCPAFNYGNALYKPKFKGASYCYGYNWLLGGAMSGLPMNVSQVSSAAKVILFGDCAQMNNFQAPASATKPMMEEFYIISNAYKTVHFRHVDKANLLFVDGHVEVLKPFPGSEERSVKGELLGRISSTTDTSFYK